MSAAARLKSESRLLQLQALEDLLYADLEMMRDLRFLKILKHPHVLPPDDDSKIHQKYEILSPRGDIVPLWNSQYLATRPASGLAWQMLGEVNTLSLAALTEFSNIDITALIRILSTIPLETFIESAIAVTTLGTLETTRIMMELSPTTLERLQSWNSQIVK